MLICLLEQVPVQLSKIIIVFVMVKAFVAFLATFLVNFWPSVHI